MTNDFNKQEEMIKETTDKIKNTIVVLSGKGGVGKSTVAANIALALANKGFKTGLLDVDIHGPSIPTLLDLENISVTGDGSKIYPVSYNENLKVISVGFMLDNIESPVVWRGPLKISFIRQMLSDVNWGELDYLIVDCPPGTGDEPLSVIQTLKDLSGAVIVTTPQKLSIVDVKKSINFCKQLNTKIYGIIENMSGFVCPECHNEVNIFKEGGGEKMAKESDITFLGKLPIELSVSESGECGVPFIEKYPDSVSAKNMNKIIDKLTEKQ